MTSKVIPDQDGHQWEECDPAGHQPSCVRGPRLSQIEKQNHKNSRNPKPHLEMVFLRHHDTQQAPGDLSRRPGRVPGLLPASCPQATHCLGGSHSGKIKCPLPPSTLLGKSGHPVGLTQPCVLAKCPLAGEPMPQVTQELLCLPAQARASVGTARGAGVGTSPPRGGDPGAQFSVDAPRLGLRPQPMAIPQTLLPGGG